MGEETSRATRFAAGSGGDDEYGSKAGSRDGTGAGLLTPATGDTGPRILRGEFSILEGIIRVEAWT